MKQCQALGESAIKYIACLVKGTVCDFVFIIGTGVLFIYCRHNPVCQHPKSTAEILHLGE